VVNDHFFITLWENENYFSSFFIWKEFTFVPNRPRQIDVAIASSSSWYFAWDWSGNIYFFIIFGKGFKRRGIGLRPDIVPLVDNEIGESGSPCCLLISWRSLNCAGWARWEMSLEITTRFGLIRVIAEMRDFGAFLHRFSWRQPTKQRPASGNYNRKGFSKIEVKGMHRRPPSWETLTEFALAKLLSNSVRLHYVEIIRNHDFPMRTLAHEMTIRSSASFLCSKDI